MAGTEKKILQTDSEITSLWREDELFYKKLAASRLRQPYKIIEGPDFPEVHILRDVISRYQYQCGRHVTFEQYPGLLFETEIAEKLGRDIIYREDVVAKKVRHVFAMLFERNMLYFSQKNELNCTECGIIPAFEPEGDKRHCRRCGRKLTTHFDRAWYIRLNRETLINCSRAVWHPADMKCIFDAMLSDAKDWRVSARRVYRPKIKHPEAAFIQLPLWVNVEDDTDMIVDLKETRNEITLTNSDGNIRTLRRVDDVFDSWFILAVVPLFDRALHFRPADMLVEIMKITVPWLFSMHCIAATLYNHPAFENVIICDFRIDLSTSTMGDISGNVDNISDGSDSTTKSGNKLTGNMDSLLAKYGADVMRLCALGRPQDMSEAHFASVQGILARLTACMRHVKCPKHGSGKPADDELSIWLIDNLGNFWYQVYWAMKGYNFARVVKEFGVITEKIDQYVRVMKFGAGPTRESDVLYRVCYSLCVIMAPFMPIYSEVMYRQLENDTGAPCSIHLLSMPPIPGGGLLSTLRGDLIFEAIGLCDQMHNSLSFDYDTQFTLIDRTSIGGESLFNALDIICKALKTKNVTVAAMDKFYCMKAIPNPDSLQRKLGRYYWIFCNWLEQQDIVDIKLPMTYNGITITDNDVAAYPRLRDRPAHYEETRDLLVIATISERPEIAQTCINYIQQLRRDNKVPEHKVCMLYISGDADWMSRIMDRRRHIARECNVVFVFTPNVCSDMDTKFLKTDKLTLGLVI